jgi:hypothetical protein
MIALNWNPPLPLLGTSPVAATLEWLQLPAELQLAVAVLQVASSTATADARRGAVTIPTIEVAAASDAATVERCCRKLASFCSLGAMRLKWRT